MKIDFWWYSYCPCLLPLTFLRRCGARWELCCICSDVYDLFNAADHTETLDVDSEHTVSIPLLSGKEKVFIFVFSDRMRPSSAQKHLSYNKNMKRSWSSGLRRNSWWISNKRQRQRDTSATFMELGQQWLSGWRISTTAPPSPPSIMSQRLIESVPSSPATALQTARGHGGPGDVREQYKVWYQLLWQVSSFSVENKKVS